MDVYLIQFSFRNSPVVTDYTHPGKHETRCQITLTSSQRRNSEANSIAAGPSVMLPPPPLMQRRQDRDNRDRNTRASQVTAGIQAPVGLGLSARQNPVGDGSYVSPVYS